MKKKLFLIAFVFIALVTVTGCKFNRSINNLLNMYIKAYVKADVDAAKSMFPPFYVEYYKESLTKEKLDKSLASAKEKYGDDFNLSYTIDKEVKMSEDTLKALNEKNAKNYSTDIVASECYTYEGTMIFKGSKKEDSYPLSTIAYCKYNGVWYIISYNQ